MDLRPGNRTADYPSDPARSVAGSGRGGRRRLDAPGFESRCMDISARSAMADGAGAVCRRRIEAPAGVRNLIEAVARDDLESLPPAIERAEQQRLGEALPVRISLGKTESIWTKTTATVPRTLTIASSRHVWG